MKGFIKVNKHTCPIWVNVSHIVYLYDRRIVLSNGKTEIVEESAFEMLSALEASKERE